MADGARLESVYTATYRGFESLFLRQTQTRNLFGLAGFLLPCETQLIGLLITATH